RSKGVHLLRDNVCFSSYSAGEEISGFKDGRADFAEAERAEDGASGFFGMVPESGVGWKKVARAADSLEFAALFFFWCGVGQVFVPRKEGALKRRPYKIPKAGLTK